VSEWCVAPEVKPKVQTVRFAGAIYGTGFPRAFLKRPIENFFLANDSTTIAIEVPVYIKPSELTKEEKKNYEIELHEPLSGHIDILQQRFTKIHILDYKPDAKKSDKTSAEQLFLYALALSKRSGIPLRKIACAYFDENNYFQLSPI